MPAAQCNSGAGGGRRGRRTLMLKTDSYSHSSDVLRHLRMFSAMREISAGDYAVRVSAEGGA